MQQAVPGWRLSSTILIVHAARWRRLRLRRASRRIRSALSAEPSLFSGAGCAKARHDHRAKAGATPGRSWCPERLGSSVFRRRTSICAPMSLERLYMGSSQVAPCVSVAGQSQPVTNCAKAHQSTGKPLSSAESDGSIRHRGTVYAACYLFTVDRPGLCRFFAADVGDRCRHRHRLINKRRPSHLYGPDCPVGGGINYLRSGFAA